ncbi:MAG: AAA family ATPase [Longimicrobiales bacterium]
MSAAPPLLATAEGFATRVSHAVQQRVVGQDRVVERLVVALLAGGHVLLEGVPGLAKTLVVRSLASALAVDFRRIQFTPDLLPSDVVGTVVFRPDRGDFVASKGPVFANLVLADELNRAPAKVQSALLEAMEEEQVTLGGRTLALPDPFMVLATENPVEQQGTYPLAEAQLDRFMMMLRVGYPGADDERSILRASLRPAPAPIPRVATADDVRAARADVGRVLVDDALVAYVTRLIRATRDPASVGLGDLEPLLELGASPRAGVDLLAAARALAWVRGRDFAVPDDVKAVAVDVLAHRLILTYEAAARGVDAGAVVDRVLASVALS